MKFTIAATLAALISGSFAQSIDIGFPANLTSVTPGSTLVVEVDQPVRLYCGPMYLIALILNF